MLVTHKTSPIHISKYVYIDDSEIPGAGLGVKASCFIPKGKILGKYEGKRLRQKEYLKLKNKDYIFEVDSHPRIYIDASDIKYSNWTRYINGARSKQQKHMINVESFQRKKNIYFEAMRNINPNEELIYDYGSHYWGK